MNKFYLKRDLFIIISFPVFKILLIYKAIYQPTVIELFKFETFLKQVTNLSVQT